LVHARLLSSKILLDHCEVTWEYATPELALREASSKYSVIKPEMSMSTPEQFDIWAMSITVLEILDDRKSFCSRSDDISDIQEKLRRLTPEIIEHYINSRLTGNGLYYKIIRKFLPATR
jgi:hypothetical protein